MTDLAHGSQKGPALGRYHLVEPIGGGPTGEVFRAKVYGVAGFERQFAVKRFFAQLTQDLARAELIATAARAYQTIEHPRIARLHEYGVVGGQQFVAVELVNGVDLARLVAATHGVAEPLSPGSVLSMIAQLARALAYAHGRGVLHLGLCPTNVVVTPDGDMKVMDFGFLRARLSERPAEDPTLAARLPYLAPEQLVGGQAAPATDVFQLATLTHELLSGERAFAGRGMEEIAQQILGGVVPKSPVPPGVAEVLERAFGADPDSRYLDAAAFADALDAAIRKSPMPGGRSDLANVVRRVIARAAELEAQQVSGAVSFPLPAPPPSLPQLAPQGAAGRAAPAPILNLAPTAPPPPSAYPPPEAGAALEQVPPDEAETAIRERPASVAGPATIRGVSPASVSNADPTRPLAAMDDVLARPAGPSSTAPPGGGRTILGVAPPTTKAGMSPLPLEPPAHTPAPELTRPRTTPPPQAAGTKPPPAAEADDAPPARKSAATRLLVVAFTLVALAAGGYVVFTRFIGQDDATTVARPARSGRKPAASPAAKAPAAAPDAGTAVAVAPTPWATPLPVAPSPEPSPSPAAPAPAPSPSPSPSPVAAASPPVAPPPTRPPLAEGKVRFVTEPPGALVYLDGALKGTTPLELPASGDRHRVAFLLEGYRLYRVEADGKGEIAARLEKAPEFTGEAGIKVRCKSKRRFYVIVDGSDTGMFCPTERIKVALGEHVVEIYDAVTDQTSTHKVRVEDTHNSLRVRIEQ